MFCICQRLLNVFYIFLQLLTKMETCFTIFLTLFNKFTPLVVLFVPACITILSGLLFSRSSFCIIFSLVPPEKLVTETLCLLLKPFPYIHDSIESSMTRMFLFCCCCCCWFLFSSVSLWLCSFFIFLVSINDDIFIFFFVTSGFTSFF